MPQFAVSLSDCFQVNLLYSGDGIVKNFRGGSSAEKKHKSNSWLKKSMIVASAMAGTYLTLAIVIVVVFASTNGTALPAPEYISPPPPPPPEVTGIVLDPYQPEVEITPHIPPTNIVADEGSFLRPPARTNFLLAGIDNFNLADAIMVGTFYRDTGEIRLMSIPRDMYTRIPEHRMQEMRAAGLRPPRSMKINAVRSVGGRTHGIRYLNDQLGEMLGVDFHFYVEIELAAFRRIVDAIGGVTMYIPRHLRYRDPLQNLNINVPAGYQHLDGRMAEGVVRFRSFPTGDLMRNQMQMEFMSQLIKQTLTREALMNDPLALANVIINDVRTNASIVEIARYLPYIDGISSESIHTFTMPGRAANRNGISWFIPNADELPATVNQVFFAH